MRTATILTLALAAALAGEAYAATAPAGPQVNINTATAAELQLLPRVGPVPPTDVRPMPSARNLSSMVCQAASRAASRRRGTTLSRFRSPPSITSRPDASSLAT